MIKFLDGPAAGQVLALRLAPVLLRVTHNKRTDEWDALDRPTDEAKPHEEIFVYRLAARPSSVHVLIRGKGKKDGGMYAVADYRFLEEQPGDAHTRDNTAWAAWCDANKERLLAEWGKELEA